LCGIVGCVTTKAPAPAAFDAARDRMAHRGPDDAGSYADPPVYLGARRLAIIDVSPDGHQPMVADGGDLAVVFNGEIYNFRQLRTELAPHAAFRSQSDTEVLLHGYRAWGWQGLLRRIDGMFAFALWDRRGRILHLARDRVGKKPLYYRHRGQELHFASTLEVLLQLLPGRPALDARAIDAFLVYQAVPAPLTVFAGVEHLPPGHEARFSADTGSLEISRYWDVSYARKLRMREPEALEEIDRLVGEAVRRRLISDVPLGSFLSGGVDSGLVTAMMAQSMGSEVEAVTLGFDDPAFDERPFARQVAKRVGARLHEYVLGADSLQSLPAILAHYGQPIADVSIVPTYFVAKAAREHVTVVLNGDGGDELFAGYARPVLAKAAEAYRRMLPEGARRLLAGRAGVFPRNVAEVMRAGGVTAAEAFRYERGLREPRMAGRAYTAAFRADLGDIWDPDDLYRTVWAGADGIDDVDRALYGDFKTYLPDQLLVKMDVATMAHSVEARSPLLDTALVEFAAQLPTELRVPGYDTKHLLKRLAERYIPSEVVQRRKRGFVMPTDTWLVQDLAPHVRATLGSPDARVLAYIERTWLRALLDRYQAGRPRAVQRVWTLWMLELWLRLHAGELRREDALDALLVPGPTGAAKVATEVAATASDVAMAAAEPLAPARPALRVLEVGMGWFPEQPGGLNRVFYQLLQHLPDVGVEVEGFVQEMATPASGRGWAVRGMARPGTPFVRRLGEQRAAFTTTLRDRPRDLVASHFAPAIWPAASLVDVPLAVHFHGPWALESRQEGAGRAKVLAAWTMERQVYRRASRLIVLSRAFADVLHEHYRIPEDRIRIVPGGVDTGRFSPEPSRTIARERLGWPSDRPLVVCVRRLVRRMGLENLLTAMVSVRQSCPDALLVIAGGGALREELEQRAADLGLDGGVRFIGRVPEEDLPLVYRAADLSVVPTVALEGFGLIVVESLACGTPVVGTPIGGIPEILRPLGDELICESAAPAHLAERLVAGVQGRLRLPAPEACAAYARREFGWPQVARRVRAVYDEAIHAG
jgi:asparagine synthase (glutamine-hydrolysing)